MAFLACFGIILLVCFVTCQSIGVIQSPTSIDKIKTGPHGSELYIINVEADSSYASSPPFLLDLKAKTPFDAGFDAG